MQLYTQNANNNCVMQWATNSNPPQTYHVATQAADEHAGLR
jgi:hypothetical protein